MMRYHQSHISKLVADTILSDDKVQFGAFEFSAHLTYRHLSDTANQLRDASLLPLPHEILIGPMLSNQRSHFHILLNAAQRSAAKPQEQSTGSTFSATSDNKVSSWIFTSISAENRFIIFATHQSLHLHDLDIHHCSCIDDIDI